uniref:DUF5703_N domain-containing protein n=1 Tax=Ascaris lumbricoides TaxID=6252 RepID=A0A0M3HXW3_ASCLU
MRKFSRKVLSLLGALLSTEVMRNIKCTWQVPADDDKWTVQAIGTPFPNNPVKVPGQQNMYVALCYIHGQPLMGRAWNDGGVVQCAFADGKEELKGTDIDGAIQVLTYDGNHVTKGFFYEWMKYSDYVAKKSEFRTALRCGSSAPIVWPDKGALGTINLEKRTAVIARNQECYALTEAQLKDMLVLVRNTKEGPSHCECPECERQGELRKASELKLSVLKSEKKVPVGGKVIKALNRPLNTKDGPQEQYVALWYHFGNAVMGRVWCSRGKVAAAFVSMKKVFMGDVGSLQILAQLSPTVAGFDYGWQPYRKVALIEEKEWQPVHISFVAPCVLIGDKEGHEYLGEANLKEEYAHTVLGNKVFRLEGSAISEFQVSSLQVSLVLR